MPDVVKIGYSTRSLSKRVAELSNATGVPVPFQVEATFEAVDPVQAERYIHESLAAFRLSTGREFFKLSPSQAVALVGRLIQRA